MSETKENEVIVNAVGSLYTELKKIIGDGKLTCTNICTVLLSLMQIVEKYSDISGVQRKEIILSTFNHFITDQVTDLREATDLKLLVQLTLPTIIDTFVSIDKKEVSIKLQRGCNEMLKCCKLQ